MSYEFAGLYATEPITLEWIDVPEDLDRTSKGSRSRRFVEDSLDSWPMGKATWNFFVREGKGLRDGAAVVLVICIAVFLWGYGCGEDSSREELKGISGDNQRLLAENNHLKQENLLIQQRNTDLQVTISPLITRAAKEFPGEEINASLKKVVEDLSKLRDPLVERPNVWIKGMRLTKFEAGSLPILEVTVVNGGKTPSKETSIAVMNWVGTGQMPDFPDSQLTPKNTPIFIAPSDAMKVTIEFTKKLDEALVEKVTKGNATLWVTGLISYVDVHSKSHFLKFKAPFDVAKAKFPLETIRYESD